MTVFFQRLNFTVIINNWWQNIPLYRTFDEWHLIHLHFPPVQRVAKHGYFKKIEEKYIDKKQENFDSVYRICYNFYHLMPQCSYFARNQIMNLPMELV